MDTLVAAPTLAAMLIALGYLAFAAFLAHRFTTPRRIATLDDPSLHGIACEPVGFSARGDDIAIAGWYLPSPGADRAVILVHGCNGAKGLELKSPTFTLARDLVARGIAVLMVDLRGHGDSAPARMTYGIRERNDVLGGVDWLLGRGFPAGAIGVLGASMGGASVLGAAVEEVRIGAVITDSTFADFRAVIQEQFPRTTHLPAAVLPAVLGFARLFTGERLGSFRPSELAARLADRPVLFIHAEDDPLIPAGHAVELAAVAGKDAWITPGATHIGSLSECPADYLERVGTFFDRHLVATPVRAVARAAEAARTVAVRVEPESDLPAWTLPAHA